jgi:hypothetical protein
MRTDADVTSLDRLALGALAHVTPEKPIAFPLRARELLRVLDRSSQSVHAR